MTKAPIKSRPFFLFTLLIALGFQACGEGEFAPSLNLSEEITFSDRSLSGQAEGMIDNQNNGNLPRISYQVDSAYIQSLVDQQYRLRYTFSNADSLSIYIQKATTDLNYHYPKPPEENQITLILFNQDTLSLQDAAVSIQPRSEYNGFHTVINIHSNNNGQYNGTVNQVPWIQ